MTEWFDERPWPGPDEDIVFEKVPAVSGATLIVPAGESLNSGDLVTIAADGKAYAYTFGMSPPNGAVSAVNTTTGTVEILFR